MVFEQRLRMAVAVLLVAGSAMAEPTAADRETARGLMKQGTAARDAGRLEEALKNFEAADAIMHVPSTGYEVAKTRATLGRLIDARDIALGIARSQPQPNEPQPFADARIAAQKLSDELEGRIPSVKITVKGATDAQITIDGSVLPKALVGLPRKLDPGKHTIVVGSRTLAIEVFEREAKEMTVDLAAPAADPVVKPLDIGTPRDTDTDAKPSKSPLPLVLMIGGYGIAVAGGVIGGITGAVSISDTNQIKKDCGGSICPPSEKSKIDEANQFATISNIAVVGACVGAAIGITGTILFFAKSKQTAIRGTIGVGSVGIEGHF